MSVTLTIDENLLRKAENATNIHDLEALVSKGLQALCKTEAPSASRVIGAFDFDTALAAAEDLPELSDAEFERFEQAMNRPLSAAW